MRPDVLIFSKDRAAQLDLLLRSMERFTASPTFNSVTVLMDHPEIPIFELHIGGPIIHGSSDTFENDVWRWISGVDEAVMFLCDDDVFFAAPDPIYAVPCSFRLGDYDYPLSLDGCTYDKNELLDLLDFQFANPTQLEAGLDTRRDRWPHQPAFRQINPCLVGIPHNRVSESSNMPTMGGTAGELNERYAHGERISLDAIIRDVDPNGGAHQTITYQWEPMA